MTQDRKTFEVPKGYEAIRDSEGRATGEIRKIVPKPTVWDSGSPTFNERCLAYIECMGQESFDYMLERYVLWGDRPVPANVLADNYRRVYRDMAERPTFIEALYRTGRRAMALAICEEAAQ